MVSMSKESVQFTEMVRLAHAALTPPHPGRGKEAAGLPKERMWRIWCEACCTDRVAAVEISGDWERYRCLTCGTVREFRVR